MKKIYLFLVLSFLSFAGFSQVTVNQGFEGISTLPPVGWSINGGSVTTPGQNGFDLLVGSSVGTTPTTTGPNSGTQYLEFQSYNIGSGNSLLTTPVIDWSNTAGATPTVSFYWWRDNTAYLTSGYYAEGVNVYVNTTPYTLSGATLLGFVPRLGSQPVTSGSAGNIMTGTSTTAINGWFQYSTTIPASFRSNVNYIIFDFVAEDGNNCYMDDISYVAYPSPNITVSPTSLAFGNVLAGVTSAVQSFSITVGSGLTSGGSFIVTAPTNYLVSTTPTGTFAATATVPYTGTSFTTPVPLYAKFAAPAVVGPYSGNITITGGGLLAAVNVAVSGTSVCNPAAITLTGSASLCTGQASGITAAPSGGSWSSSNTSIATVGSSGVGTALATGVAVGPASIIYTLPTGCSAALPVVVNLSPSYHTVTITGTGGYCAGNPTVHIGLDASSTGVNYNLYSGTTLVSPAPLAGTGSALDFGLITAPGTYNVVAVNAAGCSLSMIGSATVFLNPNPTLTAGTASSVCVGSSISLGATPTAGTWASNNISTASVNPSSGVVSGITPGTASISYTLAGGCTVNKVVTINATPVAIAGNASVCTGSTTSLSNLTTGGTWSSSNPSLAAVGAGTGVVTGVSAGAPNITYSLSTGCYATEPVVVNLLPSAYPITGGGPYCAGAGVHVGLSYANSGINYTLYDGGTSVASQTGAGSSLDFGLQYTAGTYTVFANNPVTGCSSTMAGSTLVSINPLPNSTYAVEGSGNYCSGGSGVAISLSNSDFGTSYQLINGGPVGGAVAGVGGAISFGMQTGAGTYTVLATTGAGCMATMTGSAVISINSLPTPYVVSGGGAYCVDGSGSDVMLGGSDIGTNYQLYVGSTVAGSSMPGSGSSVDFGSQTATGNYTVVATNAAGCTGSMVGNAVVSTSPLPAIYSVTGGGNYCVGGVHVGVSFSDPGFTYQLYLGGVATGTMAVGSSSSLDFGLQTVPGVYTVVATNIVTGCSSTMSGTALVAESTPPVAYTVTGTGQYCAGGTGLNVGLSSSSGGVSYQLYNGGAPSGRAITGTGSSLNFGLQTAGAYTITATNTATGCTSTMFGSALITTVGLPTSYNVLTGTSVSSYCQGGTGVDILLSGSDIGTNYQLYKGTLPVGTSVPGTSFGLNFGYSTLPGVYTVVASNPSTTCTSTMTGNIPVTINPLPNVYTVTGGGNYCMGTPGAHVGLSGSNTGISYQLYLNSLPITGAVLTGTGVALDFGYQAATGTYTAVAMNTTTSCTNNMIGSPVVIASLPPDTFALTGDGTSYCASASGSPVGLVGSVSGVSYQLYDGSATAGAAVAGTGAPINFGNHTAGTYTVVAKNSATGCMSNMPRSATISVNPVPAAFTVNGGGNACSAGTGAPVGLGGSVLGINYQLFYGGLPTATTVTGTGSAISFGPQTGGGTYTAVGIDPTSSCTSNMTGSVVVTVIPSPPVTTVTGGGSFCAGGTGIHVGLAATSPGVTYLLSNGGTTVGSVVTGTGAPIDFGLQTAPGTYSVVASPGGTCQTNMTGSAVIVVNPLPAVYSLTGGGNICPGTTTGLPLGLSGSSSGTTYQLFDGSTLVTPVPVPGTGSSLAFGPLTTAGAYSVVATSATGCSNTMAGSGSTVIVVSALPHAYNVTGGGDYCTGGAGVHVTLAGSSTDVDYQLFNGGSTVGIALPGSGTALDFGLQTAAGNYTVVATDEYSHCQNNMADMATIAVNPYLTPSFSITVDPSGNILAGQAVILTAHAVVNAGTSPVFQWYVNGLPVEGATDSSYISNKFSNGDSVSCAVTSTGMCAGITTSHFQKLAVSGEGVQQVISSGSNISLLPNPNRGTFTIKGTLGFADDEEVSIEITDMVGHAVYTNKVLSHNGSINENISFSSSVANGMYLVNVRSASANQVFHMVIEE